MSRRSWRTLGRELLVERGLLIPLLLVAVNLYGLDRAKPPWYDDTMYSAPGHYLAAEGRMRYGLEPGVAGLDQVAMRAPPLVAWTLAGWFRLVGFSAYNVRLLYLLCLAGTLAVFGAWLRRTLAWRGVAPGVAAGIALAAMALLATDRVVVWTVRAGRPEALGLLLSWSALLMGSRAAGTAELGRGRLLLVGMVSGLAIMTHPVTAIIVAGIPLQYLAQHGWRPGGLAALAAGLAIGVSPWLVLIARYPVAFGLQFMGNSAHHRSELPFPYSLLHEVLARWWPVYKLDPAHLLVMVLGLGSAARLMVKRRDRDLWPAVLGLVGVFGLAVGVRKQSLPYYLAYVVPTLIGVAALVWVDVRPSRRRFARLLVRLALAIGLVLLALYPYAAWRAREWRSQERIEAELRAVLPPRAVVVGPVELWFPARRLGMTYYLYMLYSHVKDQTQAQAAYLENLRRLPVDFVILPTDLPGHPMFRDREVTLHARISLPGASGPVLDHGGAPLLSLRDRLVDYNVFRVGPPP